MNRPFVELLNLDTERLNAQGMERFLSSIGAPIRWNIKVPLHDLNPERLKSIPPESRAYYGVALEWTRIHRSLRGSVGSKILDRFKKLGPKQNKLYDDLVKQNAALADEAEHLVHLALFLEDLHELRQFTQSTVRRICTRKPLSGEQLGTIEYYSNFIGSSVEWNRNHPCFELQRMLVTFPGPVFNIPDMYLDDVIKPVVFWDIREFFSHEEKLLYFHICETCQRVFISKSRRKQRFCSDWCRYYFHNRKAIRTGKHAKYMRQKRAAGLYQ